MKKLLLVLLSVPLFAAETYIYDYEVTLAASTGKVTIQQPSTSVSKVLRLTAATLYSNAAAVITLERSCTSVATATAQTPVRLVEGTTAATSRVYTASDASSCTAIKKYNVAAGQEVGIELKDMAIGKIASGNVGFAIASMTGTVRIYLQWQEE